MFDFGKWTSAFNDWLLGVGMSDWLAVIIECVLIGVAVLGVYTVLALFYILYERKLCAWFQCRLGPMRRPLGSPSGLRRYVQDPYQGADLS